MHIHISNLSLNIIEPDLRKMFSAYGEISLLVIVRDKLNGRSRGNAFLEMPNEKQAEQAIMALNNKLIDGKKMLVSEMEYRPGEFNN